MKIKELTKSNFVKYGGFSVWIGRRFWESRQFYSAYIALFIAISNWITIQVQIAPRECAVYELFLFEYLGIYDNSSDRFYHSECPRRSLYT